MAVVPVGAGSRVRALAEADEQWVVRQPGRVLPDRVERHGCVRRPRWWRQRGSGPEFFKIGRHLVTTIGDLRDWIEEQKRVDG